jgi:hypothetical protein
VSFAVRCPRFGDRQVCPSHGHRPQKGEDGKATGTPTELIDAMKTRALCPDLFASVGEVAGPSFSQGHLNRGPHPELLESDLPRDGHGRWRVRRSVRALDPHCHICTTRAHNSVHRHFMGGRRQKLDHAFPRKPVGYAEKCHGQSSGIAVNNRLSALRAICS